MKKIKLNELKKILKRINNSIDDNDEVCANIKKRLNRIIKESDLCLTREDGCEYLQLQQFRILMDKIINVINLRDYKQKYLDYLDALKEYEELKTKRRYLEREIMDKTIIDDRMEFLKKRLKNMKIDISYIRDYKYEKFNYYIGYLCNDSSRVIHDDNSSYDYDIDIKLLNEIENIVLFFISNIFISFCNDRGDREYLRNIHKFSKNNLRFNSSIKKKPLKKIKKELRGIA